jgi:Zn-dependent protease with chaperone function
MRSPAGCSRLFPNSTRRSLSEFAHCEFKVRLLSFIIPVLEVDLAILNSFAYPAGLCFVRVFVAAFLMVFSSLPALAQFADHPPFSDQMFRRYCEAPQIASGAEVEQVAAITRRLGVANPHIAIVVSNSLLLNAWDVEVFADSSLICVPVGLVYFLGDDEGELAFILGHEIGHATDDRCKNLSGRARVADESKSGTALAILFGHGSGDGAGDQRACETRADESGLNLMTHAGYNPENAMAALDRLSSYSGDSGAGLFGRLAALRNEHPITANRIRHLRKLIEHRRSETPTP